MADIDIVTKHAAADKSQQNRTRIVKDLKTISGTQTQFQIKVRWSGLNTGLME